MEKLLIPALLLGSYFIATNRKKTTTSEIGALRVSDKKVIESFYSQRPAEGKLLYTDGKTLEKLGMGRQNIANWSKDGQRIIITAIMDTKSTESILRYMKKYIPKKLISKKTPISNFI